MVLVIIALWSIGFTAGMIYRAERSEVSYKQDALNSAKADTQRAHEFVQRDCLPLLPAARDKCVNEQEYAAHQAEHNDRDLEAQRTTAVWTHYLGVAGIFGTGFGLLGVVLLLLTFREQRKTTRAELRAYIAVKIVAVTFDGPSGSATAELEITNSGNTPAFQQYSEGNIVIRTMEQMEIDLTAVRVGNFLRTSERTRPSTVHGHSLAKAMTKSQTKFTPDEVESAKSGKKHVFFFGTVWYEDVFNIRRYTNYCLFQQRWPPEVPGGQPARGAIAPFYNDSN